MSTATATAPTWDWPSHFGAMGFHYEDRAFAGAGLAKLSGTELDIVLAAVGPGNGRRILDVGAGTGRFSSALARAGWKVTSFDGSTEMLACIAQRLPDATLVHGRLGEPLPFVDGEFDAVVAMRVVKYVTNTEEAISELIRVVRPGSAVVFDVANGRSLARFGYTGSPIGFVTPASLRTLTSRVGLDVHATYDGPRLPHVLIGRAKSRATGLVVAKIEQGFSRILGAGHGARSIVVTATRAADRR